MTGKNLYTVIYLMAAAICVSISVYLSYWGYYSHLKELTFLFAALIGILLFGSDLLIRQTRISQKSLVVPFLFFLLIAAFSGASNYNFLYTNFMQEDIAQRTVREQFDVFRDDLTQTRKALAEQPEVERVASRRNQLENELGNLSQQLDDPLRPGCGERCRSHIETIYQILGGPPTDLAIPAPDASETQVGIWFSNFQSAVEADFRSQVSAGRYGEIRSVINEIDSLLSEYSDPDAALSQELSGRSAALLRGDGLQVISEIRQESVDIQRQANSVLPATEPVSHEPITSDLDKIGEIPVSFHDGFVERPNFGVTVVSLFLAVFVDFAPILFALVLFSSHMTAGGQQPGARSRKSRVAT